MTMRKPSARAIGALCSSLFLLCALCAPGLGLAQKPQGMPSEEMMKQFQDPEAMQRMAVQMEEMQKCMERIDRKELEALKKRGETASREIDKLCKAGKKDEALSRAMELGQEMRSDATLKQLRECTKGMEGMMQGMPWAQVPGADDDDPTAADVCS